MEKQSTTAKQNKTKKKKNNNWVFPVCIQSLFFSIYPEHFGHTSTKVISDELVVHKESPEEPRGAGAVL